LLFSGDHILNGSTTVIDPPDGDMTAYLDSLDRLHAACGEHGIGFILPAHGYVLADAADAIIRLKAHRLKREARIIAAMRERPEGTLEEWVARRPMTTYRPACGPWPRDRCSPMSSACARWNPATAAQ
jgi:recombination protein RecT